MKENENESQIISEADLREMQGYQEKRQGHGHMRESQA
jgi:hypothetical protein